MRLPFTLSALYKNNTKIMVKSQKRAEAASKQKPNVASQDPGAQIQKLEVSLSTGDFNPNPLLPLISFARHNDPEVVHKAVWALHRVFIRYIADGKVAGLSGDLVAPAKKPEIEGDVDAKGWVRERLLEYVEVLGGLIRDAEPALRVSLICRTWLIPVLIHPASLLPPRSSLRLSFIHSDHPHPLLPSSTPLFHFPSPVFTWRKAQTKGSWMEDCFCKSM